MPPSHVFVLRGAAFLTLGLIKFLGSNSIKLVRRYNTVAADKFLRIDILVDDITVRWYSFAFAGCSSAAPAVCHTYTRC